MDWVTRIYKIVISLHNDKQFENEFAFSDLSNVVLIWYL